MSDFSLHNAVYDCVMHVIQHYKNIIGPSTGLLESKCTLFCDYGGGVAEWFRALDLKSGGPWFKSFTLPLSGFVLGSPEFMSTLHALCCLPSVKKQKHDCRDHFFSCSTYNKGYQPQPSASADNLSSTLIILDIKKTSSNMCF